MLLYDVKTRTERNKVGKKPLVFSLSFSLLFLLVPFSVDAKVQKSTVRNALMIDHEDDMSGQDVDRSKIDCCILKTVTAINQKLSCNSAIAFGSAEINRPGGYVITEPGLYCLKEDVVFSPKASLFTPPNPATVQAAITIKSSDVFLDLGAHTLSQAGAGTASQVPFVVGILIPDMAPDNSDLNFPALQSIYIKGDDPAIIDGFSMFGIRIFAHTADIRLTNITVKNCALLASQALRPNPSYSPHDGALPADYCPLINNMQLGPGFGVGGISIGESSSLAMGTNFFVDSPNYQLYNRVNGLILENVSCLNNFFNGITAINITDLTVNNCHFDHTFSDSPGAGDLGPVPAWGALFMENFGETFVSSPSIISGSITNTTFNNSTMKGDLTTLINRPQLSLASSFPVYGVFEVRSVGMNYSNCQFNNSYMGFVGVGNCNVGGSISAACMDSTYANCSFDGHSGVCPIQAFHRSGRCIGLISSRNLHLLNCTANNLISMGDQRLPAPVLGGNFVLGFTISYAKNLVMENCISSDLINNSPVGDSAFSRAFDIETSATGTDQGQAENEVLRNCVAQRVVSNNGGAAIGFYTALADLSADQSGATVFENCVSTGHKAITSILPLWNSQVVYAIGSLVSFNGVNYVSLIANNVNQQPNVSPSAWSTTTTITQGIAAGYLSDGDLVEFGSIEAPMVYRGCIASRIQGTSSIVNLFGLYNYYSSGFLINYYHDTNLSNCIATDCVYGIILNGSDHCTIRNCQSDNNEIEGYTDTGFDETGTPASPTQSNSVWESNRAYNNGDGVTQVGPNGNYNIWMDAALTLRPPLLRGQLSTGIYTPTDPATYFASLHNNSVIQ